MLEGCIVQRTSKHGTEKQHRELGNQPSQTHNLSKRGIERARMPG